MSASSECRILWTRGLRALIAGDANGAATQLTTAAGMLPPHGRVVAPFSSHGELWFDVASADIKAGRDNDAARWLERLQSSFERVFSPDGYARSFFLLGQIYDRAGDDTRARRQYARFLDLWRDGDLERGWVEEAERKVGRK